jgi:hypothetical protein
MTRKMGNTVAGAKAEVPHVAANSDEGGPLPNGETQTMPITTEETPGNGSKHTSESEETGAPTNGVSQNGEETPTPKSGTSSSGGTAANEDDKDETKKTPNATIATTEDKVPDSDVAEPKSKGNDKATSKSAPKAAGKKSKSPSKRKGSEEFPDRDKSCINALLSLGRDLRHQEDGDDEGAQGDSSSMPFILPDSNDQPKKRPKLEEGDEPENRSGLQTPQDFWYWLPAGEVIGDWDVLCGRGGESNNFVGNKKYRRVVNERKEAYRSIPLKQRKAKTAFVRSIVQHVNNCGGRFVDLDDKSGRYYVVTMEKARKKTSQALRETKELKWLEIAPRERKTPSNKNNVCPYCKKWGHKTKIAKACKLHHEWLDANGTKDTEKGENEPGPSESHGTTSIGPKTEEGSVAFPSTVDQGTDAVDNKTSPVESGVPQNEYASSSAPLVQPYNEGGAESNGTTTAAPATAITEYEEV